MNSRNEAKLNMYQSVQQLCNQNNVWSNNDAFSEAFSDFKNTINDILGVTTFQANILTGIAQDKEAARNELCQTATGVAEIITAYAAKEKNHQLQQEVNFSFWTLKKLKDGLLTTIVTNIYNTANTNKTTLATYGLTNDKLTKFNTQMSVYSQAIPKPKTAIAQKKTATGNLQNLFKQADSILKDRMDNLVGTLKEIDRDFVSSYQNTRIIYDAASRSKKPIAETKPAPEV